MTNKKTALPIKSKLHPRNKHRNPYDFQKLIARFPSLAKFVSLNKYGKESIDFFNPKAVKALNAALLMEHYDIQYWDIPQGYLCPPIPGRADYIHYLADVLANSNQRKIPRGKHIRCLDIGVGANCIYPIIGNKEYGWSFVGSEIDEVSIESCNNIIAKNDALKNKIEIRKQTNLKSIFEGVIRKDEYFDLAICNPPFHASAQEAKTGTLRKLKNLKSEKVKQAVLNFGGKNNELWCEGGEVQFIENMISESVKYATSCFWFSTLVSKKSNIKKLRSHLEKFNPQNVQLISMGQGNKTSQVLGWTFLNSKQQKIWSDRRWKK